MKTPGYPSLLQMLNCAKETKIATVLLIDNSRRKGVINVDTIPIQQPGPSYQTFDVNAFFNDAMYTEANAMEVGKRFGLPTFEGVDEWMQRRHPEIQAA